MLDPDVIEDNDDNRGERSSTQVADGADDLRLKCVHRGCKRTNASEGICTGNCGWVIYQGWHKYHCIVEK